MEFKEGKCTECSGVLQIPDGLDKIICMYCGKEIQVSKALESSSQNTINKVSEDTHISMEEQEAFLAICNTDFPKLLFLIDQPMANFKKDKYEEAFKKFYIKNEKVFDAIENVYLNLKADDNFLREIAVKFTENAKSELEKVGKKKMQNEKLLDYNFIMATYIMPAVLEYRGKSSEKLVDFLIEQWSVQFPKTTLGKATYEKISEGFKWKLCYITTAVCESLGKPDDCYELNLLRDYRDYYLREQEDGIEIVKEYYDIAPTIVKRINKEDSSTDVYKGIWKQYLAPCIRYIEEGDKEECKVLYTTMVRDLQKKYMG